MFNKKFFTKTPLAAKWLYPSLIWNYSRNSKKIYLTFDDGPTPDVTNKVLDFLLKYNAKATFFCVGQQAAKHPELLKLITDANHSIGNHTHTHKRGWSSTCHEYIDDIKHASKIITTNLFRPPYGKISRKQIVTIKKQFKIIMWDVLSYDFDQSITEIECVQNVLQNAKNGSIIVFHDSNKAQKNLLYTLPLVLEHFSKKGYEFCAIKYKS